MVEHSEKVERISEQLRNYKGRGPLSIKKKAVSHEVPRPNDKRPLDVKVDISDLDSILKIDPVERTCVAEPGVTFAALVKETLKHGLAPIIVPELKTITIGGAVAGGSLESMSFMYGGFHDTCLEYEVVTAKGDVLVCTPENENSMVFQMVHGTFGTIGIITRLKFNLIPAKPYVRVAYEKYGTLADFKAGILRHFKRQDVMFMDGIVHSPRNYVLNVAKMVDEAPYANRYDWTKAYHESTLERDEDYLRIEDYYFRYDKGVTHTWPRSFLGRLLFRKLWSSNVALKIAAANRWIVTPKTVPITIDVFIPFSRSEEFLEWFGTEMDHYPVWCVPYKRIRDYEWIATDFARNNKDELFLDFAVYGMRNKGDKHYYRLLEEELLRIGGLKTLISGNYYSEEEFWTTWNRENYLKVKTVTDPDNVFRDLYSKTCLATRGIGR